MKTRSFSFLLTFVIVILSGCGSAPGQTIEVPPQVRQTALITRNATETPAPQETPENSSNQQRNIDNFELSALLKIFPLVPDTSWSYTGKYYSQAANDPNTNLKATTYIEERVIDTQSQPPYYLAHIQRNTTLVNADPGWQDNVGLRLGKYEFWYVVRGGRVYLSSERPDPAHLRLEQLSEELDFPLTAGLSWCPNKIQKGSLMPVAETAVPCASAGARKVLAEESYTNQAGSFDRCYQMSDFYNSGSPIQVFCEGVGIVAEQYDHGGTRFGSSKELVTFKAGTIP